MHQESKDQDKTQDDASRAARPSGRRKLRFPWFRKQTKEEGTRPIAGPGEQPASKEERPPAPVQRPQPAKSSGNRRAADDTTVVQASDAQDDKGAAEQADRKDTASPKKRSRRPRGSRGGRRSKSSGSSSSAGSRTAASKRTSDNASPEADEGNGPDRKSSKRSRSSRSRSSRSRRRDAADSPAAAEDKPDKTAREEEDSSDKNKRRTDKRSGTRSRSSGARRRRDHEAGPQDRDASPEMDTRSVAGPEPEAASEKDVESIMLVNDLERQEVRIAVLEDGRLQQLFQERASQEQIVGNIHKGVVVNLVPNIEAAFVEFGYRKHGFLHVSDVLPSSVGKTRRDTNIRSLLREGQEIIVQVTKEGIGDKGPSLTTYLSLPGRYMVLMPGLSRRGVSRRIVSERERSRLRSIVTELDVPDKVGLIARTAGEGRNAKDLGRDLDYLVRLWHAISERAERSKAPALIYQESDPVTRVIRDVFTEDTRQIIVDSEDVCGKVREFLQVVLPRHVRKVKLHEGPEPLFHRYGVEQEIEQMHGRTVQLPSGGSIVLDQTEAMVTIDVNSGQYKGRGDAEKTAFNINMDAAGEIARQIRLRDLGGVIAIDFIDMEDQENRTRVEQKLWQSLKGDRSRLRMLKMSPFCIVEMTRQRQRHNLRQTTYATCPCCRGTGLIKSHETLALQAIRQIKAGFDMGGLKTVELSVTPEAANYMNNAMREGVSEMEQASGKSIRVLADPSVSPGTHTIRFLNAEGREISATS